MDSRVEEAKALVAKSIEIASKKAEKRKRVRETRRVSRPQKKRVNYTLELGRVYSFLYNEKFGSPPPKWGKREFGQCKNLIDKVGDYDKAEKLVRYVFRNWSVISLEVRLGGAPLIGDILARCLRYVDVVSAGKDNEKERIGAFEGKGSSGEERIGII